MDRSHPVILKFFEKFRLERREATSHDEDELPAEVLSLCRPLPANIITIWFFLMSKYFSRSKKLSQSMYDYICFALLL